MQTQIPIKLPECDILSHGDDSDYDTAEDADDDGDGDERKGETIWIFFLTRSRRKKGRREKRTMKKKKKKRERERRCCFSLSLSLCSRTRETFLRSVSRSFVLRYLFTHNNNNNNNSFSLKTQKRRTTRSARRGDETHHETRERNERVGFARVIEGGASRGVLFAATRMAFGVEEFDAQSVAENRVGEIRESTVGVLLRVLSGDFSRVGDRG